jgi:hypothetical protein
MPIRETPTGCRPVRVSRARRRSIVISGEASPVQLSPPQLPPSVGQTDPRPDRPRFWRYLFRGLRLRCPECGRHPVFVPARKVRSLYDWFAPLDGCPHCGYPYEREAGYFLLATWAVNYGLVAAVGLTAGLLMQSYTRLSTGWIVAGLVVATPLFSVLISRHAKAAYLAIDHYFDPARRS